MASAIGNKITFIIDCLCSCGNKFPVTSENRKHTSLYCENCDTHIDYFQRYHSYRHGCDKHDELVKLGIAEASRQCVKGCVECQTELSSNVSVVKKMNTSGK